MKRRNIEAPHLDSTIIEGDPKQLERLEHTRAASSATIDIMEFNSDTQVKSKTCNIRVNAMDKLEKRHREITTKPSNVLNDVILALSSSHAQH